MDIGSLNMYTSYITEEATANKTKSSLKLENDYSQTTEEELMDACKQFEAYFLEQVMKEMVKTIPKSEESSDANSNLVDYFKDNMIQELAAQSTETNSLGLAQMLYDQMKVTYGL